MTGQGQRYVFTNEALISYALEHFDEFNLHKKSMVSVEKWIVWAAGVDYSMRLLCESIFADAIGLHQGLHMLFIRECCEHCVKNKTKVYNAFTRPQLFA